MFIKRRDEVFLEEPSIDAIDAIENDYLSTVTATRAKLQKLKGGAWKSVMDILCALIMLVMFAPLMSFIALLIWRSDGCPVLFSQLRVGKEGKLFKCYKFRTMIRESEAALEELIAHDPEARRQWKTAQKLTDDPRVIPGIGTLLRKTSLDELPQLINVLKGEMSLVGPRPIVQSELERYGRFRHHYTSVKPGLTGVWQVNGRSDTDYEARVRMDVWYVECGDLGTDVAILALTAKRFLMGELNGAR